MTNRSVFVDEPDGDERAPSDPALVVKLVMVVIGAITTMTLVGWGGISVVDGLIEDESCDDCEPATNEGPPDLITTVPPTTVEQVATSTPQ
ncbi:MAG TPA: hypothetical protein VF183_11835 [Acidimicrobiales bacterium]